MPAPLLFTMSMVIFTNDVMLANTPAHVASSIAACPDHTKVRVSRRDGAAEPALA